MVETGRQGVTFTGQESIQLVPTAPAGPQHAALRPPAPVVPAQRPIAQLPLASSVPLMHGVHLVRRKPCILNSLGKFRLGYAAQYGFI